VNSSQIWNKADESIRPWIRIEAMDDGSIRVYMHGMEEWQEKHGKVVTVSLNDADEPIKEIRWKEIGTISPSAMDYFLADKPTIIDNGDGDAVSR